MVREKEASKLDREDKMKVGTVNPSELDAGWQ
jgi:hypothetical protein